VGKHRAADLHRGRIKGNVQAAKARWVQSANFYLGTVQTAFGEVRCLGRDPLFRADQRAA
jgi:hypothetical protein